MASKHMLDGLIKWSTREHWVDRFELILSTVWACAFEDFLTREFDDGENAVDDYLKRRGWKESASIRAYMAALRRSTMSLYEVSDIVRGTSWP